MHLSEDDIAAAALSLYATLDPADAAQPLDVDQASLKVSFEMVVINIGPTLNPSNRNGMSELNKLVGENRLNSHVLQASTCDIFDQRCTLFPAFAKTVVVQQRFIQAWDIFRNVLSNHAGDALDVASDAIGGRKGWALWAQQESATVKPRITQVSQGELELVTKWEDLQAVLDRYGVRGGDYEGAAGALPMLVGRMCASSEAPFGVVFVHGTDCMRLKDAARSIGAMLENSKPLIDYANETGLP
mmetsp:Transcript_15508/g.50035  ORF Transcript_15508/g.50035 Transcript_15508/m.50035 type:complete len:244 (-) Transcript_15508:196-927(-)